MSLRTAKGQPMVNSNQNLLLFPRAKASREEVTYFIFKPLFVNIRIAEQTAVAALRKSKS